RRRLLLARERERLVEQAQAAPGLVLVGEVLRGDAQRLGQRRRIDGLAAAAFARGGRPLRGHVRQRVAVGGGQRARSEQARHRRPGQRQARVLLGRDFARQQQFAALDRRQQQVEDAARVVAVGALVRQFVDIRLP